MTTKSIHGYPKIPNVGSRLLSDWIATVPQVVAEEKYDGSQLSFRYDPDQGRILYRSKRNEITPENAADLFQNSIQYVESIPKQDLTSGWVYRVEAFKQARHNSIKYGRVPAGHMVLYGIETQDFAAGEPQTWASRDVLNETASQLGMETVAVLYEGAYPGKDILDELLIKKSSLGGVDIEGVVLKPARPEDVCYYYGKTVMAKYVSKGFKEQTRRRSRPGGNLWELAGELGSSYGTQARWDKAVLSLEEDGLLTGSPRDIGPIMKRVREDVIAEHKQDLMEAAWKKLKKPFESGATSGLPEWYKEKLLLDQDNAVQ